MIAHTKGLKTLKTESQRYLDYVVLVKHAIPSLVHAINHPGGGAQIVSERFNTEAPSRLATLAGKSDRELARSTIITLFSFFEAYVKSVLEEIVEFHAGGDKKKFVAVAAARARKALAPLAGNLAKSRRQLQEPPKPGKREKYKAAAAALDGAGYRFPTELLAVYGAAQFVQKLDDRRGMKAWEIPDILEYGLLFDLSKADRTRLDEIRSLRNKIAHGDGGKSPTFEEAMKVSADLRRFAVAIDAHVVEHFLLSQAFA